jgi:hypothetical protein
MDCLVCGKPAGISSTKIKNGKICKECASKLPSLMLEKNPYYQDGTLKNAMNYAKEKTEEFSATASYGKLHIDSIHGLFCIANSLTKDGKPKSGNNIFSMYDLAEVGLVCKSPRADKNNVIVDIEFSCSLENPHCHFSTIVKKGARCQTRRIDVKTVEWDEPNDLCMFRSMFNQMLSGAFEKINDFLCGKTVHEFEIEKARALFMLPEDYTADDLKKAYRLMMKVWHPDKAQEDVTREAQILNEAHALLKAELEYREYYSKNNMQ